MVIAPFYLVTEDAFHASYLLNDWHERLRNSLGFGGIIVRAEKPEKLEARLAFHETHAGEKKLAPAEWAQLETLYPGISPVDKEMIAHYGIPKLPREIFSAQMEFVGKDLNGGRMIDYLHRISQESAKPRFYVFLDQLLKHDEWRKAIDEGRVFNAHSAVLPYTAGMHAIEQIAALEDVELFKKAAGATVHYVNHGIDSGPVVNSYSHSRPLSFDSIHQLKGASFMKAFGMLEDLAEKMAAHPEWKPEGIPQDLSLRPHPPFKAASFTNDVCGKAEQGYLEMQKRERTRREPIPLHA